MVPIDIIENIKSEGFCAVENLDNKMDVVKSETSFLKEVSQFTFMIVFSKSEPLECNFFYLIEGGHKDLATGFIINSANDMNYLFLHINEYQFIIKNISS